MNIFNKSDIDNIEIVYYLIDDIDLSDKLDFNLHFKHFDTFDLDDSLNYQILEYFSDIDSIFKEYQDLYADLMRIYMTFYQEFSNTFIDNKFPNDMQALNLDDGSILRASKLIHQTISTFLFHLSISMV